MIQDRERVKTYLRSHSIPLLIPNVILKEIITLRKQEQENGKDINAHQHSVSVVVEWFILVAVDVCCDDAAELDTHYRQEALARRNEEAGSQGHRLTYCCTAQ